LDVEKQSSLKVSRFNPLRFLLWRWTTREEVKGSPRDVAPTGRQADNKNITIAVYEAAGPAGSSESLKKNAMTDTGYTL
jgi:hypothetical protein